MADPIIQQSRKNADPELADAFLLLKKDIFLNMNCHAIAQVQSFDSSNQTVTATVMYKKTYFEKGEGDSYKPVLKDYPILLDVPVIILGGGNFNITFPIQKGDECLILFNDRSIDNWFQSGQVGAVASSRLHSFSDGIALIGLRSAVRSISSYDTTRAAIRNGQTMVGISATLVKIANATTTLGGVIDGLIDVIKTVQTIPAVPGSPLTLGPVSIAQLESYKTTVAGLLE